jgi:hypothetical protein
LELNKFQKDQQDFAERIYKNQSINNDDDGDRTWGFTTRLKIKLIFNSILLKIILIISTFSFG